MYRNKQYIWLVLSRLECMHLSHVAHSVLVLLVDASPFNTCHTSLQVCTDNRTNKQTAYFKQHTRQYTSSHTTITTTTTTTQKTQKSYVSTNLLSLGIANNGYLYIPCLHGGYTCRSTLMALSGQHMEQATILCSYTVAASLKPRLFVVDFVS